MHYGKIFIKYTYLIINMSAINILLNINKLSIKLRIKFYSSKLYKHYLLLGKYN